MTKTSTTGILLACIMLSFMVTYPLAEGQGAESAVNQAQKTLAASIQAISQAQSEGANVDALMITLIEASDLLSKAQLANSAGDYSTANDYASQCQNKLSGVTGEAASLQQAAADQKNKSFIFTTLTLLISAALLVSGIVSWFMLNKRERRITADGSKSI